MKKLRRHGLLALAVVVILAAGIMTVMRKQPNSTKITSDLIAERLEYVQDLVGIEYYYQNVSSIEKSKIQKFGVSIPFTASRAIFSYEGVIKYGIDVSQVEVGVSGDTVTLTVPKAKIISHEIPEKDIEIFDEGRNLFNPVTIGDYVGFQSERKAEMETRAAEKGFPAMAEVKCGEALRAILKAMPDMKQYDVSVNYS